KQNADNHLRASKLAYTIVRPGKLTEDDGTGKVRLAERFEDFGEIPRQDVAAVLEAVLENPATAGREFDLLSGDQPVEEAVTAFVR
ncbi:NAD(P)H-binding protein, partial [Alloalcanivorax venustensis]|uniref:NAD(P)H-binding protein n=1 Tax=Alloalcanivorax venustensis TaxID=172371 RepID=UPI003C5026A8